MKLPDLSQQARPIPQASMGVARYQPESMASAAAPGEALARTSLQVGEMVQQQIDRADTMRAEDAFNQLRQRQQQLTMGEGGFVHAKGSDAVTKPLLQDYSKQFDDAANQISETLGTPQQKALFRKRADVAGLQFQDDLMRHIVREGDVYEEQIFKGASHTEAANVSQNWDKPDAVALSTTRMQALVDQRAKTLGWAPEVKEAVMREQMGNLHEGVIDQALANHQYSYAEGWFKDHKDQMDQPTLDRLAKKVEDGTQRQLTNDYQTQYLAAMDNGKALGVLEKTVSADPKLDDQRKNILIGRIQSRSELLANRAERAQAQQDRRLQASISAVNALTLQGFEPTVEQMGPLITQAKGTAYEPLVKQMVATADTTRKFRLATPAQQEQFLTQMEASARQDPTKFDVNMIGKLREIHDNQQKLLKEDPTSFAVRQGLVAPTDEAAKPLDLTNPDNLAKGLLARFDVARSMQSRYGAPMKPLTKEETNLLTSYLANAPAQAKRDLIGNIAKATANDRPGYTALMAQIAPDDPVSAIAGLRVTKNPAAADLLIQGQSIHSPQKKADGTPENGKLWPMPPQKDFDVQFTSLERDAFAGHPQARNGYYQATRSIYAALAAKEGDASGVINSDRLDQAFKLATGGVEKYNGKGTVMPYGMTRSEFKDQMDIRLNMLAGTKQLAEGMTKSKLEDMPLEPISEGRYLLKAGDGILVDRNNKPVIIDFNQPTPGRVGKKYYPAPSLDDQMQAQALAGMR